MNRELVERIKQEMDYELGRSGLPEGFRPFPDIPAGRYTDPEFFRLEREYLWKNVWLLAAHEDELPDPGSYKLWEDGGIPVFLMRGKDGQVRAFYNACQHRGGPLVWNKQGSAKALRCRYHSWTYDLEGKLIGVPDERDFGELDKSCRNLTPLRCERWGPWYFVNQDASAPALMDWLGKIPAELKPYTDAKLRYIGTHSIMLNCNWKIVMEAFQEVYHLPHIHPSSVNLYLDHRGATMGLLPNGHSRMVTPMRMNNTNARDPFGLPRVEGVGDIYTTTNVAYSVFPNLVTPIEPNGFPFLMFWPLDVRTTRLDSVWFGPDWGEADLTQAWKNRMNIFDVVLDEDTQNLEWMQRSIESDGLNSVPLNYQERRIYHCHEQIDKMIGVERIPAGLAVEARVGGMIEQ